VIYVIAGIAILAALVMAGRRPALATRGARLASLLLSLGAAVAAVAFGMRGLWIGSVVFIVVSAAAVQRFRPARAGPGASPSTDGMSASRARSLLGVGQDATRAQIEAAYRRLMLRVHPDHGGAAGLATELNAARARLLGKP